MVSKFKNIALALGSIAILGLSVQAQAVPAPFTINPDAIPGTTGKAPFNADFISGTTSELLHVTATQTTGSGFLQGTGFSLNSNAVFGNVSGLGNTYGLYVTFQLAASGAFAPGVTQTLSQLNFQIYADPNLDTTFRQASVSGNTGTEAAVTGTTSDDLLLGFGTLISGTAGLDLSGGVFVNALQSFLLCSGSGTAKLGATTFAAAGCTSNIGTNFFSAPVPFYSLAFDEFNNTGNGVTRSTDGSLVAIRSATGGVDFVPVPEPGTIALFGIAAVAAGLASRRRKA